LADLALPTGWIQVSERDAGEGPNGRWIRNYARFAGAPDDEQLEFVQAFDGPANASGGEDTSSVDVAGQPALLYRHAPSGSLVLVWMLDGDGFAIGVNEQVIPVDELIEIAESVRLARP
jgi:hypothetical protein